ncbi:hypothetical protein, partial [Escherichia coli]|uniref:hypothetical protein n=1 Tax=Escherichia coli TaxID=562 RepID=UPI001BC87C06
LSGKQISRNSNGASCVRAKFIRCVNFQLNAAVEEIKILRVLALGTKAWRSAVTPRFLASKSAATQTVPVAFGPNSSDA